MPDPGVNALHVRRAHALGGLGTGLALSVGVLAAALLISLAQRDVVHRDHAHRPG